jgi:uncharacterized protein YggE
MAVSNVARRFADETSSHRPWFIATVLAAAVLLTTQLHAQQPQSPPDARITVTGVGSVRVPPDVAHIRSGVTTRARTVKEASDANAKVMTAIMAALAQSGIASTDIQTSRFSVQPVYAPSQPGVEQKLSGYSVSNQVEVTVRQIANVGDILDRLAAAGATDIGNIAFLVSDPAKALDQAREAAVNDARHKAELYARASGASLGRVLSITEEGGFAQPVPLARAAAAAVPIAAGEDTLQARITVAYEIAR